jgi:hypothetical protein
MLRQNKNGTCIPQTFLYYSLYLTDHRVHILNKSTVPKLTALDKLITTQSHNLHILAFVNDSA